MNSSCSRLPCHEEITNKNAVDSFFLEKIHSCKEELGELKFLNDTTIIGFDLFNSVNFYSGKKDVFGYKKSVPLHPSSTTPRFFNIGPNKRTFYLLDDKKILKYDSSFHLADSTQISYTAPVLKNKFYLSCTNEMPLIQIDDTLICNYTHDGVENFYSTYKENALIEFTIKKSQATNIHTYLKKPAELVNYDSFCYSHCFTDNVIYKLYGPFDTIYCYDRLKKTQRKIPINNAEFTAPEKIDLNKTLQGDFKYQTKYFLSNFSYSAIFFNEKTKHFILFYKTPAQVTDKNPMYRDKKLKALVLNKKFEKIKYLTFNLQYHPEASFFMFKNKGLVMPVYNNDPENEKTTFYIYNF